MSSDSIGQTQPQRAIFQGDAVHFPRAADDQSRFLALQYAAPDPRWNLGPPCQSDPSDEEDEDEEEEEDADDDDLDEGEGCSVKNGSTQNSSEKGIMAKDGNLSKEKHGGVVNCENAVTVVQPESYCGQIANGREGSGSVQKENGKEVGFTVVDPWESVRMHLLDPITGVLMDDAMILPCGHSFGHGGIQLVFRMKSCSKCSHPISEDLVRPNLALRSAVKAFQREEASQSSNLSKRRRERFEQEKCNYDNPYPMDSRTKHVRFPFVVSDKVIIKGNKRTPERFVGRVGVVTTQCLNGWYVVKTLDNAESVKLQYRSLAKFTDNSPSSMMQSAPVAPNWL